MFNSGLTHLLFVCGTILTLYTLPGLLEVKSVTEIISSDVNGIPLWYIICSSDEYRIDQLSIECFIYIFSFSICSSN